MENSWDFLLSTSDPDVTRRLKGLDDAEPALDRRFTQEEDFFLVLDRPFVVDSFEIHHDVHQSSPSDRYRGVIRSVVDAWADQIPAVFQGLSWFFDPKDLFHPLFVQVLSRRGKPYLFVLRPDLTFRGRHDEVLDRGGNDTTPRYSTSSLFLESEVLPLESWDSAPGEKRLFLSKLFQKTWEGESGQGYFLTGRWIDREISRLLSRVALPQGAKVFPYYPLRCRHDTLSVRCLTPTSEGRKLAAQVLETAWPLVTPWAERIQTELKALPFQDDHPLIEPLRQQWGPVLAPLWASYRLEPYLNENDQKEYRYHAD